MDERGAARDIRRKINEVIAYMKSLRTAKVDGQANKHTALGTIKIVPTSSKAEAASTTQRFVIKSIADNWLVCRKVDKDEAETSTTDIKVMRPIKLRDDQALPADYKDGSLVEASQSRSFDRTINGTDYTVSQEIYPPYAKDDFIYGANNISGGTEDDGSGTELEWVDLNVDGRHWQYSMREIEVCVNDAIKKAIAQISEGED